MGARAIRLWQGLAAAVAIVSSGAAADPSRLAPKPDLVKLLAVTPKPAAMASPDERKIDPALLEMLRARPSSNGRMQALPFVTRSAGRSRCSTSRLAITAENCN